ncbi:MAG: hypothetical protein ACM33B_10890 [Pseudomonadota bacterium]
MTNRGGTIAAAAAAAVAVAALGGIGRDALAAAAAVPTNVSKPTISGIAQQGQTLTGEHGDWSNGPNLTYAYQWQRCPAATLTCTNIPGETSTVRVITDGDVGFRLRLEVRASNADGTSAPAYSDPSAVIVKGETPAVTRLPSISGTAREGETLTADRGEWSNNPTSYAYQWQRCSAAGASCVNIPGETSTVRIITNGDVGSTLRVIVTASNAGGSSSAASAVSGVVAPRGAAPANTSPPTISGTPQSGQTLTASTGAWSNSPTSYAFQWQRCNAAGASCANIPGETQSTRIVAGDDVGNRLRVLVTATNAVGSAQAASAPTDVIATGLPAGAIRLANGKVSIPVTSVSLPERLIVDAVRFTPNPVRSRGPITVSFHVADTRGYVVRDALVFVRSVPLVTTTPPETATRQDGWITMQVTPKSSFPLNGKAVQFFVRARKQGEDVLAGVSTRRLVQVRTARP